MNWLADPLTRARLVAILLIALGLLLLVGAVNLGIVVLLVAIMLVVLGLLMLIDQRRTSKAGAAIVLVLGVALLLSENFRAGATLILGVVAGLLLVLVGAVLLRLAR